MDTDRIDPLELARRVEKDGFVLIKNVVSKGQLSRLDEQIQNAYERARQSGEFFEGGGRISGHLNCFPGKDSRFVLDDLTSHGVIDVIRTLTPAGADQLRPNCNVNLPQSVAQHYHIDGYYTEPFYLCTVAVIDADLVNGAMDILPGTNQRFYRFWQYALQRKYRLSTRCSHGAGRRRHPEVDALAPGHAEPQCEPSLPADVHVRRGPSCGRGSVPAQRRGYILLAELVQD